MYKVTHPSKNSGKGSLHFKESSSRILYIDDNEDHLLLVKEWLSKDQKGLHVELASDARTAYQKLKAHGFDLILLDYKLGDVDGLEILKELKLQGVISPIVMLTGQGDEHTAAQAIKWGAKDYVCKGADNLGELLKVVGEILEGS